MANINAQTISAQLTPQTEPLVGKNQVRNDAGGYSFVVTPWVRLERFLILGSEGGSYYTTQQQLTLDNATIVHRCIKKNGLRTVALISEISTSGRGMKNSPAIFALAMAASFGNVNTQQAAYTAIPSVCRTGTHLFEFVHTITQFRGWGRALRRGISQWYVSKSDRDLAYQLTKYQSRVGWSHRDLLRLCHTKAAGNTCVLFKWAVGKLKQLPDELTHPQSDFAPVAGFQAAATAYTTAEMIRLIREYRLVRECIPTKWLNERAVWEALLEQMPLTAMLRNLAKMTRVGVFEQNSQALQQVLTAFSDEERIRRSRLHPMTILIALRTYTGGKGVRSTETWEPIQAIVDVLDRAFYAAFANVEPTGKRMMLALDVSGSMGMHSISGMPNITPRDASVAMALVTATCEPTHQIVGFTAYSNSSSHQPLDTSPYWPGRYQGGIDALPIRAGSTLNDAINIVSKLPFGATDCALPMQYALAMKIPIDVFVIYTDNETWAGRTHPTVALQTYREQTGIPAKLIVVGMVANQFSIADPNDAGMLDVVGFDTTVPQLISQFASAQQPSI